MSPYITSKPLSHSVSVLSDIVAALFHVQLIVLILVQCMLLVLLLLMAVLLVVQYCNASVVRVTLIGSPEGVLCSLPHRSTTACCMGAR